MRHTDDMATLGDGRRPDRRRQLHLQHLLLLRPSDASTGVNFTKYLTHSFHARRSQAKKRQSGQAAFCAFGICAC